MVETKTNTQTHPSMAISYRHTCDEQVHEQYDNEEAKKDGEYFTQVSIFNIVEYRQVIISCVINQMTYGLKEEHKYTYSGMNDSMLVNNARINKVRT